jgi:hypothetical protein
MSHNNIVNPQGAPSGALELVNATPAVATPAKKPLAGNTHLLRQLHDKQAATNKIPSIRVVPGLKHLTPIEQFYAFHKQNPHVFTALRAMSQQQKALGFKTGSIRFLCEKLRWDIAVQADGVKGSYAVPTSCPAYYARAIMAVEPSLAGFFTVLATHRSKGVEIDLERMGFKAG